MIPFSLLTFSESMHQMWAIVKGMDPMTIFKYYALACMIFFPFICLYLIYLYKHTNVFKKIDAYLELKLDGKPGPAAEKLAEAEKKEEAEAEQPKEEEKKEDETEMPFPILNLRVGDKYICQLSDFEQRKIGNLIEWVSSNPFIASIPENGGLLKAEHEGECNLEIASEGQIIYKVIVSARKRNWYLGQDIFDLFNFGLIDEIKARQVNLTVKALDFDRFLTEYVGDGLRVKRIIYQADKKGKLVRFVYELLKEDDNWKDVLEQMSERMMEIKDENNERPQNKYWYHLGYAEDDEQQTELFADYVAFMKVSTAGTILVGVGKSWRYGGTEDEIKDNLAMIERSFIDCLDESDVPGQVGTNINEDDYKQPENNPNMEPAFEEQNNDSQDPNSEASSNDEGSGEDEGDLNEGPDLEDLNNAAFETDEPGTGTEEAAAPENTEGTEEESSSDSNAGSDGPAPEEEPAPKPKKPRKTSSKKKEKAAPVPENIKNNAETYDSEPFGEGEPPADPFGDYSELGEENNGDF